MDEAGRDHASVKLPSWRLCSRSGHALQLTTGLWAGRIIVPANHSVGPPQPEGKDYQALTFFSDDHGATWHLGEPVPGQAATKALRLNDRMER